MSTLEALMKAEKSLLDESIPYNHMSFTDCTCGHILRAVEGKPGYAGSYELDKHPEYAEVIKEVAMALGFDGKQTVFSIFDVSNHTSLQTDRSLTRQNALKTIRTAMMALQPAEPIVEYATA